MAAFSIIVSAAEIQALGEGGTFSTLTLPTGVSLIPGARAHTAVLNNKIIITGSTSAPIWLGADLVLRRLSMPTPANAPTLATGAAGAYTGTRRARVSYVLKNSNGVVIAESPLGPISNAVTVAAKFIDFTAVPVPNSTAPVTGRRIYLTSTGGATYFPAFDIDDITTTTASDDESDASLSLLPADPDLVSAPSDLDLLVTWKNRVWGKSAIDNVVGTSAGRTDRWPNSFSVDPKGTDGYGVTGFLPRRDELAIGRRHVIWKLVGADEDDFALVKVAEGRGILAPDSCRVINDVGYFLSDNGVWTWDAGGITCITDANVRPWFTTDTYFNRALFPTAFAEYDPVRHRYLLFLPNAGDTVINRWVEYDIASGTWFGPHLCAAVTSFLAAAIAPDANGVLRLVIGANDGYCYAFTPGSSTDGASTAIDFDIAGKFHSGEADDIDPDLTRVWLEPTVFTAVEAAGTLSVIPSVGGLAASAGTTLSHPLTSERTRLARPGVGRLCQIRLRQNVAGQGVSVYGYDLPYITLGRR